MCESAFINFETQMTAEVHYIHKPFRTNQDHRYKVILRDIDSDNVAGVVYFFEFDEAEQFAEKLVFPSNDLIDSPTFLPQFANS